MLFKIENVIVFIALCGFVLMNFTLGYISNFPITIGTVCFIIYLCLISNRLYLTKEFLTLLLIAIMYPLGYISDVDVEFIKSYLQYVLLVFAILFSIYSRQLGVSTFLLYGRYICFLGIVLSIFTIIQFISLNLMNSYFFINPFGAFSAIGPGGYVYEPHPLAIIKRPNGFYSEPSILGWVLTLFLGGTIYFFKMKLISKQLFLFSAASITVAAFCTVSLSGIINIILLFCFLALMSKNKSIYKYVIKFSVFVCIFILIFNIQHFDRFNDLNEQGTSSYFRVIAPLKLISDSLIDYPLGVQLGDLSYIESKIYMVNWAGGSNTNIENGFLVLIFHLGLLGLVIFCTIIYKFITMIIRKDERLFIFLPLCLAVSQTGAIMSPNLALTIGFFILLTRSIQKL